MCIFLLPFAVVCLLLGGCSSNSKNTDGQDSLTVIKIERPQQEFDLDELYESIEFIALEKQDLLLSGIRDVQRLDDCLFVLDEKSEVVAKFDLRGKYLTHINKQGRGPDEYLSVFTMNVDPKTRKVLLTDSFQGKIFIYDEHLNLEQTIGIEGFVGQVAAFRKGRLLHGQPFGDNDHPQAENDLLIDKEEFAALLEQNSDLGAIGRTMLQLRY